MMDQGCLECKTWRESFQRQGGESVSSRYPRYRWEGEKEIQDGQDECVLNSRLFYDLESAF